MDLVQLVSNLKQLIEVLPRTLDERVVWISEIANLMEIDLSILVCATQEEGFSSNGHTQFPYLQRFQKSSAYLSPTMP